VYIAKQQDPEEREEGQGLWREEGGVEVVGLEESIEDFLRSLEEKACQFFPIL
jgi:hypothetical protein